MKAKLLLAIALAMFGMNSYSQETMDDNSLQEDSADIEKPLTRNEVLATGIPQNAIPAKAYSYNPTIDMDEAWTEQNVEESCLNNVWQGFGKYYFFVSITKDREYELPMIDIWCLDKNKMTSKRVYHQFGNEDDVPDVADISWEFDIISKDTTIQAPVSKRTFSVIAKHARPVLVLSLIQTLATPHFSFSVVLIDINSGRTKVIDGEKLVSVFKTNDTQMLAAEIGLGQSYILTTTTDYKSNMTENIDITDEDEEQYTGDIMLPANFIDKTSLTPSINVYSLEGNKVGSIKLPTDIIDVIR